ncbi:hypothetical protein D3C87_2164190 [compost metagenome]
MLSPQEAKMITGERTLRRSTTVLPSVLRTSPAVSRLPTNSFCTIQSISARFIRKWPPHQRSKSRKRGPSVSAFA